MEQFQNWVWMMLINKLQILDNAWLNKWDIRQPKKIWISLSAANTIKRQLSSDATSANKCYARYAYWLIQVTVMKSRCLQKVKLFKIAIIWLASASLLFKSLLKICKNLNRFHPNKLKCILNRFKRLFFLLQIPFQVKLLKIKNRFFNFKRNIKTLKMEILSQEF